jgi:hypothetical protein
MAEPVVLSGSSLNTFLRCARQWEYAYVQRLRRPPSLKAALGIAAHDAVETDLRQKIVTRVDIPKSDVVDAFATKFRTEAADSEENEKKKETRATMLDSGVIAVGHWYDHVAPATQPVLVEQNGQFLLTIRDRRTEETMAVPYDWTLDMVDEQERVRDWKFVSKKPSGGQEYVLNMVGYAVGYRRLTGKIERGVQLDHIVRTKVPQYVPISSGPIEDESIFAFAGIVKDVVASINAGIFPPTGLKSNACSWCGYADICPAYKKH